MKKRLQLLSVLLLLVSLTAGISCSTPAKTESSLPQRNVRIEKVDTGKKILVVYYSKTGNTERVAKDIAGSLSADIEKISDREERSGCIAWFTSGRDGMNGRSTEIDPVKMDPSKYDIVIIGSPVWGWNMTPAIRTYIEQNRSRFRDVAFFVTAGGTTIDRVLPYMETAIGKKPVRSLGLVKHELSQRGLYNAKVNTFVKSFKGVR